MNNCKAFTACIWLFHLLLGWEYLLAHETGHHHDLDHHTTEQQFHRNCAHDQFLIEANKSGLVLNMDHETIHHRRHKMMAAGINIKQLDLYQNEMAKKYKTHQKMQAKNVISFFQSTHKITSTRKLQTVDVQQNASQSLEWNPLRLKYIYDEFDKHITDKKSRKIVRSALDNVSKFLAARLNVLSNAGVELPSDIGTCGGTPVASQHLSKRHSDADLIIVVNGDSQRCKDSWLAYASHCLRELDYGINGRPVAGSITVCPRLVSKITSEAAGKHAFYWKPIVDVLLHEILHVIGISSSHFWRYPEGSLITSENHDRLLLASPISKQTVKDYFDCDSAEGIALENDGGSGSESSHFDHRFYDSEVMTSTATNIMSHFSIFTAAALQDSGWYQVNHILSEYSFKFGYQRGCQFLQSEKCQIKQFPAMFAPDKEIVGCSYNGKAITVIPPGLPGDESCPLWASQVLCNEHPECLSYSWAFQKPDENFGISNSRCIRMNQRSSGCVRSICQNYDSVNEKWQQIYFPDIAITCNENEKFQWKNTKAAFINTMMCPDIQLYCDNHLQTEKETNRCYFGEYNAVTKSCQCFAGFIGQTCDILDNDTNIKVSEPIAVCPMAFWQYTIIIMSITVTIVIFCVLKSKIIAKYLNHVAESAAIHGLDIRHMNMDDELNRPTRRYGHGHHHHHKHIRSNMYRHKTSHKTSHKKFKDWAIFGAKAPARQRISTMISALNTKPSNKSVTTANGQEIASKNNISVKDYLPLSNIVVAETQSATSCTNDVEKQPRTVDNGTYQNVASNDSNSASSEYMYDESEN